MLDQVFADGQIFNNPAIMLNIIVRSVALGIVAVGQSLVIIGASIDLSVAYTISITAVMSSYLMQGKTENVPMAILVVFAIGAAHRSGQWTDHHKAARQSLYCHPGHQPDHQRHHQCHLLQLHRQRSEEFSIFWIRHGWSHTGLHPHSLVDRFGGLVLTYQDEIWLSPVRSGRQY